MQRGATPALSLEAKGRYAPRTSTWERLHSPSACHLSAIGQRLAKGRVAPRQFQGTSISHGFIAAAIAPCLTKRRDASRRFHGTRSREISCEGARRAPGDPRRFQNIETPSFLTNFYRKMCPKVSPNNSKKPFGGEKYTCGEPRRLEFGALGPQLPSRDRQGAPRASQRGRTHGFGIPRDAEIQGFPTGISRIWKSRQKPKKVKQMDSKSFRMPGLLISLKENW